MPSTRASTQTTKRQMKKAFFSRNKSCGPFDMNTLRWHRQYSWYNKVALLVIVIVLLQFFQRNLDPPPLNSSNWLDHHLSETRVERWHNTFSSNRFGWYIYSLVLCMIAPNSAYRLTTKRQFHTNLEMRSMSLHLGFLFRIMTLTSSIRVTVCDIAPSHFFCF